jgi:hypothetical protein
MQIKRIKQIIAISLIVFFVSIVGISPHVLAQSQQSEIELNIDAAVGFYEGYAIDDDGDTRTITLLPNPNTQNANYYISRDIIIDKCLVIKNGFDVQKDYGSLSCLDPFIDGHDHIISSRTFSCILSQFYYPGKFGEERMFRDLGTIKNLNIIASPPTFGENVFKMLWARDIECINISNPHCNIITVDQNQIHNNDGFILICASNCNNFKANLNAAYSVSFVEEKSVVILDTSVAKNVQISNVRILPAELPLPDRENFKIIGICANSCQDVCINAYMQSDDVTGIIAGNAINCHVNIQCGDPGEGESYFTGLFSSNTATGIRSYENIDSCSVHSVHGKQKTVGMCSERGSITHVRVSYIGNTISDHYPNIISNSVTPLSYSGPCEHVVLCNIHGTEMRNHPSSDLPSPTNLVWISCGTDREPDYENPVTIEDLRLIMARIESNIVMRLNALGTVYDAPGTIVDYISNDCLGKMAHGIEHYQDALIEHGYKNSNSIFEEYDLSRINISFNYDTDSSEVRPEIILRYKGYTIETQPSNAVQEPPMTVGSIQNPSSTTSNEDYSRENAIAFFNNKDALSEGVLSYIDPKHRKNLYIGVFDDALECGSQFSTPQTEESINNYYSGLINSINISAKKYGIGPVPVRYYYIYPKCGTITIQDSFNDCFVPCYGSENDTPHSVVTQRPLQQNTTSFVFKKDTSTEGARSSICVYATCDDDYYVILCGHHNAKGQAVYQSGLVMKNGMICFKNDADMKKDRIDTGGIIYTFDPVIPLLGHSIETDASIAKLDSELSRTENQKSAMYKVYYHKIAGDKIIINHIITNGMKGLEYVKNMKAGTDVNLFGCTSDKMECKFAKFEPSILIEENYIKDSILVKDNRKGTHAIAGDSGGPAYVVDGLVFKNNYIIGLTSGYVTRVEDNNIVYYDVIVPIEKALEKLKTAAKLSELKPVTK